jgi:hypothetical protein
VSKRTRRVRKPPFVTSLAVRISMFSHKRICPTGIESDLVQPLALSSNPGDTSRSSIQPLWVRSELCHWCDCNVGIVAAVSVRK